MVNPYLFPDWRGSLAASVKTRKPASSSTLLQDAANEQNFPRFRPRAWHSATRVVFIYCRYECEVSREDEETKESHAGGRGVSKGGFLIHPFLCSSEVSNRPTLSLRRRDRQSRKKKDPEGAARIFLVDHSLRAPSFTFTRDSFRRKGEWLEEGREALTWRSDNRRWSIFACENVSAGKEIFFRIAHPSQSDSLAWVAFNTTRKDEKTVIMLD